MLVFGSDAKFEEMDHIDRQAWAIVIGEMNGGEFNFNSWTWVKKD